MKDLQTALMTFFNATTESGPHNSLYNLVSGKIYKERAKQNASPPYVVFHIISNTPDYNFTSTFENVRIQFDLISNDTDSSANVEDMFVALRSLFDWCSFTVNGSTLLYMRRSTARLSRDPEDDNWMYQVDYEIMTERD